MLTDEELIEEIKNGSQAAMEVLVRKHYKRIFAYIYRTVGDYHIAYDLTQEVFVKMMQSLHLYQRKGRFANWLITIAVNHCRDFFGSRLYKQASDEKELQPYVSNKRDNVWNLLSKKWESEQVRQAIQQLPTFQREPIILRFYHDYKMKEIAKITKSNESTVKSRIRQGTNKLKRILEKRGVEDDFKEKRSNYPS